MYKKIQLRVYIMKFPIWIVQLYKKQRRIWLGVINTYVRKAGVEYSAENWWDKEFYSPGITSDASTISVHTSEIVSQYHYASIELGILELLFNNGAEIKNKQIGDIGSGAGHWLEFYKDLGATKLVGMDISRKSCDYLTAKFASNSNIDIKCGKAVDLLKGQFDVINAIGVMFHIVDDSEWLRTIQKVSGALQPGGMFIVGGHFGLFNNLNVQFDRDMHVNKRLRSLRSWKNELKKAGFKKVLIWRNHAYLKINWLVPESNIIVAFK